MSLWCSARCSTTASAACPGCGVEGRYRDTVIRTVTDVPVVGHPLRLRVQVPRYRCVNTGCEREVFAHNTDRLARRGWSTTRRCARYILRRLMIDRATIAAVARELGLSWDTVNTIAMDATQMIVAAETGRLDGVRVIGVDEHRWSHTRRAGEDGYVTVIIDLTPVLEGTGRARLLDLVPGRSAAALTSWLSAQSAAFRDRVEVVAMDGFGGYKTAATDQLPEATPVMDPFHVVALAGAKLDLCRQRIQQATAGTVAAPGIRSTGYDALCAPVTRCSTLAKRPGWKLFSLTKATSPSNCAGASTSA
jgi:transposase